MDDVTNVVMLCANQVSIGTFKCSIILANVGQPA